MERRVLFGLLALTIVLGAYLRLADLGGPSLWLDEILHLQVTQSLSDQPWYRLLVGVREIAGKTENGALYYGLQILGQRLAPGETGVRLMPAIIGILTLPPMALPGGDERRRPRNLRPVDLVTVEGKQCAPQKGGGRVRFEAAEQEDQEDADDAEQHRR